MCESLGLFFRDGGFARDTHARNSALCSSYFHNTQSANLELSATFVSAFFGPLDETVGGTEALAHIRLTHHHISYRDGMTLYHNVISYFFIYIYMYDIRRTQRSVAFHTNLYFSQLHGELLLVT